MVMNPEFIKCKGKYQRMDESQPQTTNDHHSPIVIVVLATALERSRVVVQLSTTSTTKIPLLSLVKIRVLELLRLHITFPLLL